MFDSVSGYIGVVRRYRKILRLWIALSALMLMATSSLAAPPHVVASILPIHSLVASVMEGVGKPVLLLPATISPHAYAMRPSDAKKLADAQIVFWIGEAVESFLAKPLRAIARKAHIVTLIDRDAVTVLPARHAGQHVTGEEHGHDHDEHGRDGHLWLDPVNAVAIVKIAVEALTAADAENGYLYARNGARLIERLKALERELRDSLAPVHDRRFVVFHESYQYFERRFGLMQAASVTISPDRPPGAKRLTEIQTLLARPDVVCMFAEPQFTPALIGTLTRGISIRTATLDPLGSKLTPGPGAYEALMRGMAQSFKDCLGG